MLQFLYNNIRRCKRCWICRHWEWCLSIFIWITCL